MNRKQIVPFSALDGAMGPVNLSITSSLRSNQYNLCDTSVLGSSFMLLVYSGSVHLFCDAGVQAEPSNPRAPAGGR